MIPVAERRKITWTRKVTKPARARSGIPESQRVHVARAMLFLARRHGNQKQLAAAMGISERSVARASAPRGRATAWLVMALAEFVGVSVDDLLKGKWPPKGACPHCGRS